MQNKIKKICSSRQSNDFLAIARIESFIVGKGLKDALKRDAQFRRRQRAQTTQIQTLENQLADPGIPANEMVNGLDTP